MFKYIAILLCFLLPTLAHSSELSDSMRVSVLTCSPGQEVYALYGHTAIRVQHPGKEVDEVFNYGVFSFSKPHFLWRFVLGQCDYMVESLPWDIFVREYLQRGSSITAQELNLTQQETQLLVNNLQENCLPENCVYRYNFLYNNCTTKVRDMVEQAINGHIQYPDTLPCQTFREILHLYTEKHPWAQEGNDLLLGAEVDTLLTERAAMFAPENMMNAFNGAFICTPTGDQRPLVLHTEILLEARPQTVEPEFPLLPWQAMLVFAIGCLFVLLLEAWTRRLFWLWDVLLLLLQGMAGTLLTFMLLFSEHPAVGSNWQVWILNPIALIGIPLVIKAAIKHENTLWYTFQFAVITSFLLFSPWIPQEFAKITIPLALCLLTRPVSYYIFCQRRKKKKRVRRWT